MLAVNFHERRADRAQGLQAHGLVVDQRSGAAIGELYAAKDQLIADSKTMLGQQF